MQAHSSIGISDAISPMHPTPVIQREKNKLKVLLEQSNV
jgi:hypothetical protein